MAPVLHVDKTLCRRPCPPFACASCNCVNSKFALLAFCAAVLPSEEDAEAEAWLWLKSPFSFSASLMCDTAGCAFVRD